jgi:AcrR family transcriptional regulator
LPRDAAVTRERLITAGRELFARPAGLSTPLKQIVDAAGQRNTSALHYHFAGRDGLIAAIIEQHNVDIETERGRMLDELGESASLRDLVETVIRPQAGLLDETAGRQFLSIVSQLNDIFDKWDDPRGGTPTQALRAFRAIESSLPDSLDVLLRRERVTRFLEMVSEALGSRARRLERSGRTELPNEAFVENLTVMAVGALSAAGAQ